MANEATPLRGEKDEKLAKELRDKVTTSYTTIALVSALLSAVSFAAYSTPPSELYSSAATAPPGPPAPPSKYHIPISHKDISLIHNAIIAVLWYIYGLVMPLAFVFNLFGTLAASGVILYINSTLATDHAVIKQFSDRTAEHGVIKFPAAFLVFGVLFLFAGFAIGIVLFYGIIVALALGLMFGLTVCLYQACFAETSNSGAFDEMNISIAALFFRSCNPSLGRQADEIYERGVEEKRRLEAERIAAENAARLAVRVDPRSDTMGMGKCC